MLRKLFISLPVVFLLLAQHLAAQGVTNGFIRMTGAVGLSSNNITKLHHDSYGFIWIGTPTGLLRYDGRNYVRYTPRDNDSSGLADGDVRSVFEDSKGQLWVGSFRGGVSVYDPELEKFRQIKPGRGPKHVNDGFITSIAEDKAGRIWLGTVRAGLDIYFPEKDSIFHLQGALARSCGISNDSVKTMYATPDGNIWVGINGGILLQIQFDFPPLRMEELPRNIRINRVQLPANAQHEFPKISSIGSALDGTLLICTDGMGIFRFDPKGGKPEPWHLLTDSEKGKLTRRARKVIPSPDRKGYWIATFSSGILFADVKGAVTSFRYNPMDPLSLSNDKINDILSVGNELWIGTVSSGISILRPSALGFRLYQNNPYTHRSLSSNSIFAITEDHQGKIWASADSGILNVINPVNHEITRVRVLDDFIRKGTTIMSLLFDREGNLWVGGYGGGIQRLKFNSALKVVSSTRYSYQKEKEGCLNSDFVTSIQQTRNGEIWITTVNGINRYNPGKGNFTSFRHTPGDSTGLPARAYMNQYEDLEGDLWFGSMSSGVTILPFSQRDADKPHFLHLAHEPRNSNSLSDNVVTNILQVPNGDYWISTARGLDCFNPGNKSFTHYTTTQGLSSELVYNVLGDKRNNLWIISGGGLSKLNLLSRSIRNYTPDDGLPVNDLDQSAVWKSPSGYHYYGGNSGIVSFNPDLIQPDSSPPALAFTNLRIFSEGVEQGSESILHESITTAREIVLSYRQNVISFEWAVLDYGQPTGNQSAVMLEGYEDKWRNLGTASRTTFTNLSPGKYVLHVKGANSDGVWNEEGMSIRLVIRPPFYGTTFFRILMVLLILGLAFSLHRYRLYSLNHRKKELESQVKERTLRLEKANQSLINQHLKIEEQAVELKATNEELLRYKDQLEDIIRERTAELLAAKLKAEESDRLKTSFLANMSHEIRTPMNAIVGFSGLMAEKGFSEEERTEFFHIIQSNSEYLLRLINDIIDLSMIHSGQLKLTIRNSDIHEILMELFNSYQRFSKETGENIKQLCLSVDNGRWFFDSLKELQPLPPLWCVTDPARLRQILINLLDNAFKYTEKGRITFGYRKVKNEKQGELLEFFVKDTGMGISEEMQEKIFDRFFKIENSQMPKARGTGLGLSITRSLAEHLGGEIAVQSRENEGSVFILTIPLRMEDETKAGAPGLKVIPELNESFLKDLLILVAEDELSNYELFKGYLGRTGAVLLHAVNGEEALRLFSLHKPSIILMDLKMDGMGGLEAMKQIRTLDKEVLIIAQTAQVFLDEVDGLKAEGFDEVLLKPIRRDSLIAALQKKRSGLRS